MTKRTIHHFEDEPELVRWIPSALLNRYWLERPHWIIDGARFEEVEDEPVVTFRLDPPAAESVTIEYRVYRTKEDFKDHFSKFVAPGDIVLLDVMSENPQDGSMLPFGLTAHAIAVRAVGTENVYFLTAFPQRLVRDAKNLDDSHVIAKPPDADALITILVNSLAIRGGA